MMIWTCGPDKPHAIPGQEEAETAPELGQVQSMLQSEDENQRGDAILLAMQWDMKATAPRMLELAASDKNPAIRQTAALALGQFKVPGAASLLRRMLEADQGVQAEYIMEAATRLGDPSVGPALVPYLKSDVLNTRLVAMQTLVAIGASAQGNRILADAKTVKNPEIGRAYTMVLGKLKIKAAGPHLRNVARTVEPGPNRAAAFLALGRIKDRAAVPVLVQGLQADIPKLRENASKALIMVGDSRQLGAIYPLLTHAQKDTRYRSADVLGEIPTQATAGVVIKLLKEKSATGAGPAARVAGRLKLKQSRIPIENRLKNRQAPEREELAKALGWLGDPASVDILMRVLDENDGDGRYGAAWSLGIIGSARAIPALVKATRSSNEYLARMATEALGNIEDAAGLTALIELARSNNALRVAALDAIAITPGEKSAQLLLEFLTHSDPNARRVAIRAVGDRKLEVAIPALIAELKNADPDTRPTVIQALQKISGKKYSNMSQWLHWAEMRAK